MRFMRMMRKLCGCVRIQNINPHCTTRVSNLSQFDSIFVRIYFNPLFLYDIHWINCIHSSSETRLTAVKIEEKTHSQQMPDCNISDCGLFCWQICFWLGATLAVPGLCTAPSTQVPAAREVLGHFGCATSLFPETLSIWRRRNCDSDTAIFRYDGSHERAANCVETGL